jgi:hypothetical protein
VALTWDVQERAFFRDPLVAELDGLPYFLTTLGEDAFPSMRGRVGWFGYQHVELALGETDPEYAEAFRTMDAANQPSEKDYKVAEANLNGGASPESAALAAKLAHDLFHAFEIIQYAGSYSVKEGRQTVAKVIPGPDSVFVGVRDSKDPAKWFQGQLETVSVQGVEFFGLVVPVNNPDVAEIASLAQGLLPPR